MTKYCFLEFQGLRSLQLILRHQIVNETVSIQFFLNIAPKKRNSPSILIYS